MYKLVIIDDEEKIVEGIAYLFPWEQIGYEVTCFSEPLEALDYIENNEIDVLLTDIQMPHIDGIELSKKLFGKQIKIVFMSSHQNYEYFRYAIQYQVEDYLLKPIKSTDIVNCFGKITTKLAQERETHKEIPATYYEQVVETVKAYIQEHYKDANLDHAAVQVNLSRSYLSKLFKEQCGIGFAEYLTKIRMEKACELLNDIKYKSYDIAYYIGYDNPKNFSRAFKAYYGKTPTEYRNNRDVRE